MPSMHVTNGGLGTRLMVPRQDDTTYYLDDLEYACIWPTYTRASVYAFRSQASPTLQYSSACVLIIVNS